MIACGGCGPHTPRVSGATRPRTPRFTFGRPKVNRKTAKTKVLDSFFYRFLSDLGHLCAELGFCQLICGLVLNETPPVGLLKGTCFLRCLSKHGSCDATTGVFVEIKDRSFLMRGNPKGGGRPLLCRCGWGIFKGEGESKPPPP